MTRHRGHQIAIGKASVYTAAAGIHPRRIIPVVLDVGTDNLGLLNNELYIGVQHARVRGERYDDFVDRFVSTASRLFPKAMIHWEDFGAGNAHRLLTRYRDDYCTFNDDIQGTAAVVLAAILAAVNVTGIDLHDHRIVVFGAGSAGIGIANLIRTRCCAPAARRPRRKPAPLLGDRHQRPLCRRPGRVVVLPARLGPPP